MLMFWTFVLVQFAGLEILVDAVWKQQSADVEIGRQTGG